MHDVYFKPEFLSTETWKDELPGEVSPEVLLWQKYFERFPLVRAGWQDLSSQKESSTFNQNYPARSVYSWTV